MVFAKAIIAESNNHQAARRPRWLNQWLQTWLWLLRGKDVLHWLIDRQQHKHMSEQSGRHVYLPETFWCVSSDISPSHQLLCQVLFQMLTTLEKRAGNTSVYGCCLNLCARHEKVGSVICWKINLFQFASVSLHDFLLCSTYATSKNFRANY